MSHLTNKSATLSSAAALLHENELYPAVAHSAYYCCVQQMKHIWLYSMQRTEEDLKYRNQSKNGDFTSPKKKTGLHEFLINNVVLHIKKSTTKQERRLFNNAIWQLRDLRVSADYFDKPFGMEDSKNSLSLSKKIMLTLQKC
jgi:hypothetical protein